MARFSDRDAILTHLRKRPSVASAIAIGHYHVLDGAPLRNALAGLEALAEMPCTWTVAILEQAMTDPTRRPIVRQRAAAKVRRLLTDAARRGYAGLSGKELTEYMRQVRKAVAGDIGNDDQTQYLIADLCTHLAQAIIDGWFGRLPTK